MYVPGSCKYTKIYGIYLRLLSKFLNIKNLQSKMISSDTLSDISSDALSDSLSDISF